MTVGVLFAIIDAGLRIPQDVGIIGFDDMPWARLLTPPLTTVSQPTYELDRIAADLWRNGSPDATTGLRGSCYSPNSRSARVLSVPEARTRP